MEELYESVPGSPENILEHKESKLVNQVINVLAKYWSPALNNNNYVSLPSIIMKHRNTSKKHLNMSYVVTISW